MIPNITIRQRLAALVLTAVGFVLGLFDRGLDGIIGSLSSLEEKLARYEARLATRADIEHSVQLASYDRESAVFAREAAVRRQSRDRQQSFLNDRSRSQRIRERIAKLID